MSNQSFYGATPQATLESKLDANLEELAIRGFTVIEDVIAAPELAELRTKLDKAYAIQQKESEGLFKLEDINEENQVRAPLCYDDHFLKIASHDTIVEPIRRSVGNYFLIHLQIGIINMPNVENRQAVWHRDLLYVDYVSTRPMAVSVMLCVDDFNEKTGGTLVVPFTHRLERMPSKEYVEKHAITIDAKAGSVFLMDSMLVHKAGFNSSGSIRRGLNTIYCNGLLKQQISFGRQLDGKHREDPFLNMLLGYDAEPSESVLAWRKRRYNKLFKK